MTFTARLEKATQGLTPLQRIQLLLRANREDVPPDPNLSRVADPSQSRIFNRYIALLCVINDTLGSRCQALRIVCQDLEDAAERIRLLEHAASLLEAEHGLKPPRRPRDWRRPGQMEVNEFLRSLAREQRRDLVEVLALRWQELRAVELAWAELATEFGGEDPVGPELREIAVEGATALRALATELGATKRLTEPDEEMIAELEAALDEAFARLDLML